MASMVDTEALRVSTAGERHLLSFDWGLGETIGGDAGDQNSWWSLQRDSGLNGGLASSWL